MNEYITISSAAVSTYNSPLAISTTLFTINLASLPIGLTILYTRNTIL